MLAEMSASKLMRLTEFKPEVLVWYKSDISRGPMLLLESVPSR